MKGRSLMTRLRGRMGGRELNRYESITPYLREVVPEDLEQLRPDDYMPADVPFARGVDLREGDQLSLLASWEGRFDALFACLRTDPEINTAGEGAAYLHNGQYPTPDAELYAAMVGDHKPARIVEIGAGYSTRIARRTIDELSLHTELVVVDPEPRADVSASADTLLRRRIEEVNPDILCASDRSLLFVDSSHVSRSGGDVPFIFCRLIPELPPGTLVHVHDVFLPYDYPPAYRRRLYSEAYVLWALLARNSSCQVKFATYFMVRNHPQVMQRVFGTVVGTADKYIGASFWFVLT